MSTMANTTPIMTTVTKPATNPRDTDATLRVNIQDFCEEYYEDIIPIIMDKVRRDKRKEVLARLDFGEGSKERRTREDSHHSSARAWTTRPKRLKVRDRLRYGDRHVLNRLGHRRQSAFDQLSEIYSPSTTKSRPGRTNSRDHPHDRSRPYRVDTSNKDCLEDKERFCGVGKSYDDSYSHSYHDRDRSRHMKRRRDNESPLSSVSKVAPMTEEAARVWFDELLLESIDSYKDLKAAFLAYFMQQKKYVNVPQEIHIIKQKDGETIKDFMEQFKVEIERMKGDLNIMEEMMITPTAFTRGEAAAASKKKGHTSWRTMDQSKRQTSKKRTPKEILTAETGKFQPPPPMVTPVEKRSSNKFYDFHNDKGHSTDECMQLKKQIEEFLRAGKLSHLIKELKHGRDQSKAGKKEILAKDKPAEIFKIQSSQRMTRQNALGDNRRCQSFYKSMYEFYDFDGGIVTICSTTLIPAECITVITSSAVPKEVGIRPENFKVALHPDFPDPEVAIGGTLSAKGRTKLCSILKKNLDIFAWQPSDMTGLVDKAFDSQISQNIKVYVDELVVKSHSEAEILRDIDETFRTMRKINMKLNPKKSPKPKEELIVYFSAIYGAISTVLMSERGAIQMPVYFISRALQGLKLNYTPKEKLVLSQFSQPSDFGGRLQKWSVMLGEHNITYRPRTLVKGQVLADFRTEMPDDNPPAAPVAETQQESWTLFTDGSSCVDGFGAGLILTSPEGTEFTYALRFQFVASNNEVEYEALIAGLRITSQMRVQNIHAEYVIREIHEGSCSMHAGPRSVVAKAIRLGYYSPTMHRDARDIIHTCNDYQIHRPVTRNPHQPLTSITTSWPFYKWGIDIAGPFPEGPVKHSQSNGLVERANQSLREGIKARLGERNKNWVEELLHVLWAHRTMIKSRHCDTPFSLTYGTEGVISAEIRMPTYRIAGVDVVYNDEELRLNLDLLEERHERATIHEAKAKLKMTKYYNARVRGVTFRPGDFFYRSNDASHAVEGGKLGPKWEEPYEVTEALGDGAYKLRSTNGTVLPRTWNIINLKRCYL
nr:hypothetical protein [Tanacetum cinerariifolium]